MPDIVNTLCKPAGNGEPQLFTHLEHLLGLQYKQKQWYDIPAISLLKQTWPTACNWPFPYQFFFGF
jgi:hypothetical protein